MAAPLALSPAALDDLPAIERVVRAAYELYVSRIGREPAPMRADHAAAIRDGRVVVARSGDEIVGMLETVPALGHLLIENVAVDPARQGEGIGGALLDEAEAQARALGVEELRLYTNARMTENLAYYPRRGFQETDRRTEDGYDRVYFTRRLEPRS